MRSGVLRLVVTKLLARLDRLDPRSRLLLWVYPNLQRKRWRQ